MGAGWLVRHWEHKEIKRMIGTFVVSKPHFIHQWTSGFDWTMVIVVVVVITAATIVVVVITTTTTVVVIATTVIVVSVHDVGVVAFVVFMSVVIAVTAIIIAGSVKDCGSERRICEHPAGGEVGSGSSELIKLLVHFEDLSKGPVMI